MLVLAVTGQIARLYINRVSGFRVPERHRPYGDSSMPIRMNSGRRPSLTPIEFLQCLDRELVPGVERDCLPVFGARTRSVA